MTSPPSTSAQRYSFDDLFMDVGQRRLWRGQETIAVTKLTFALLRVLVERAPNLVGYEEFAEKVWGPRRYVTQESVAQRMKTLRRILGDEAGKPRYIESVRGQGYRLIPSVRLVVAELPPARDGEAIEPGASPVHADSEAPERATVDFTGSRRRYWLAGLATAALALVLVGRWARDEPNAAGVVDTSVAASAGPGVTSVHEPGAEGWPLAVRRSVAVLPFANLGTSDDSQFFTDGIHDDVITQLAKIASLRVISRTSALQYRETAKSTRQIGAELGVAAIVEGSVRRVGDSVRVNVQLIHAQSDRHLWAETYERELTVENLFAIQSEMATSVARALEAALTPSEVERLRDPPTRSVRAYDFYLSGKEYRRRTDTGVSLPLAVQQFSRAVQEDPGFALAFAELSIAQSLMHWYGIDRSDMRRRAALDAVTRAFELVPDLPEAHHAMGRYYYHGFRDYEPALRELAIAARGLPSDAEVLETRSYVYRRLGQWDRALAEMEQALELDPRSVFLLSNHSLTYLALRDYTSAERFIDRALEVAPDAPEPYWRKAQIPLFRDGNGMPLQRAAESVPAGIAELGVVMNDQRRWLAALYARDYAGLRRILDSLPDRLEFQSTYLHRASLRALAYRLEGQAGAASAQYAIARAEVEKALQARPEDERLHIALGEALAGVGEREAAVEAAERALARLPPSADALLGRELQQEAVMRVLLPAGDYDRALALLAEFLSVPGAMWSIEGLLPDPRLDPIRTDPRLLALIEKFRRR